MDELAEETRTYWQKQRDAHIGGIGERLRSMSLGALALIWGLLMGDHSNVLKLDRPLRNGLLGIALAAVVVLLLDFADYWMGYQLTKMRSGDRLWFPNIPFIKYKERLLMAKQLVGFTSLVMLVCLLGFLLFATNGNGQDSGPVPSGFLHTWCGNNDEGSYKVLKIESGSPASVQLCSASCDSPTVQGDHVLFTCNARHFDTNITGERLHVTWTQDNAAGSYDLTNCDNTAGSCPASQSSGSSTTSRSCCTSR
jgi:hypothetical protein